MNKLSIKNLFFEYKVYFALFKSQMWQDFLRVSVLNPTPHPTLSEETWAVVDKPQTLRETEVNLGSSLF